MKKLTEIEATLISPKFLELSKKVECEAEELKVDTIKKSLGVDKSDDEHFFFIKLKYKNREYKFYQSIGSNDIYPCSYTMLLKLIELGNYGAMSYKRFCEELNKNFGEKESKEEFNECLQIKYDVQEFLGDDYMTFVNTAFEPIY